MFSKLQFQNLLIYENISNFVQVQGQENLQNTTVNINLYRSLNYIFTLTFTLKNDSARIYGFGKQGMAQWRECSPVSAYQCGPGSNPGVDAICGLSLLLVLSLAPRGFSPGTPVFPSPQKPIFPNSNSTRNQVDEEPLCGCVISKSSFIYFLFKI